MAKTFNQQLQEELDDKNVQAFVQHRANEVATGKAPHEGEFSTEMAHAPITEEVRDSIMGRYLGVLLSRLSGK